MTVEQQIEKKGKELIEKFMPLADNKYWYNGEQIPAQSKKVENAKQCAIICCEEMIKEVSPSVYYMKQGYKVKKPIHIADNFFKSLFNPYYAHFKLIMYKPCQ